jgi:S1-C subfamily serine protease
MKISGANPGGPAEKAGMLAGDIVIKIGENPVADIYKYMGILGLFKKGEGTPVTVLRDGKEVVLDVIF